MNWFVSGDVFVEEHVLDVMMTVVCCEEKSAVSASDADGVSDAGTSVIPQYLLHDQQKSFVAFNTCGQQQREEFELIESDSESDLSFSNYSADVSDVSVEFLHTDAARTCVNTVEHSEPSSEEVITSELTSFPEAATAVGSEDPYEFEIAECNHRPEGSVSEDVCTFLEETTSAEIQELISENVEEQSAVSECVEKAEMREKAVGKSVEQLMETAEESSDGDVEEVPATEQVEGCEIASEVVEAELKQKVPSETGVQDWCLEADDVDDLFEEAYDGKLSSEEIPQETVVLDNKSQAVCSSSNQLLPDVFDGATEDISAVEIEDVGTPSEIPSDTALLESRRLEDSHTSDQELVVVDEEAEVKELAQEIEEVSMSPDEVLSAFVVAEAASLMTMNTCQQESPTQEEHPTEVLPEHDTMAASCDEVINDFVESGSTTVFIQHAVCDGVIEVNEEDQYSAVSAVDEETVAEPQEIGFSSVSTSLAPKAEYLTTELIGKSSFEDSAGDNIDELCANSIDCEVVENLEEAGSVQGLPESLVAAVREEHLAEESDELPGDVTPCVFVSEATEDADSVPDSSASVELLPVTTVSSAELTASSSLKIEQQTEQQLSITEEDSYREIDDTVTLAEPVVNDVIENLETAQTAEEPEVYEMYVEEELTIEEKITETIVTTVHHDQVTEVKDEVIAVEDATVLREEVTEVKDEVIAVEDAAVLREEVTEVKDEVVAVEDATVLHEEVTEVKEEVIAVEDATVLREEVTELKGEVIAVEDAAVLREEVTEVKDEVVAVEDAAVLREEVKEVKSEVIAVEDAAVLREEVTEVKDEVIAVEGTRCCCVSMAWFLTCWSSHCCVSVNLT